MRCRPRRSPKTSSTSDRAEDASLVTTASASGDTPVAPGPAPFGVMTMLLPLLAVIFIVFFVVGLALPVMPLYVNTGLGFGAFAVGLVAGSRSAASFLARFVGGAYSDRRGPKRAVLVGLTLAPIAGLLYLASLADGHGHHGIDRPLAHRSLHAGRCRELRRDGNDELGNRAGRSQQCRQGARLGGHRHVRRVCCQRARGHSDVREVRIRGRRHRNGHDPAAGARASRSLFARSRWRRRNRRHPFEASPTRSGCRVSALPSPASATRR